MDAEDQAYSEFEAAVINKTKELKAKIEESLKREEDERRQKEELPCGQKIHPREN